MTIRVGIIGAGTTGRAHAISIVRDNKGAALAAISELEERNVAALRSVIGAIRKFAYREDVIASPDVDAVIIASPDYTHTGYTAACIREGKPVLCEKPLAYTAAECRKIVFQAAAPEAPAVLVGFMRRFEPAHCARKTELAREEIGLRASSAVATWTGSPLAFSPARWAFPTLWSTNSISCGG